MHTIFHCGLFYAEIVTVLHIYVNKRIRVASVLLLAGARFKKLK